MAFETSMTSKVLGLYDDELLLSHFEPGNNGNFIARDSLLNIHHSGGNPEAHPTLANVVKNTNGHVLVNGTFRFDWEWEPGTISETDVDEYLNWFNSTNNNPNYVMQKDIGNNKLIGNISISAGVPSITNWSNIQTNWILAAPKAKCTFTSDESEIICVSRLNGTYGDYTFEQRTIESGETVEIYKPDCTACYVMFTDHLLKAETTLILMKGKLFKLVNPSIRLTNAGPTRTRILRYYK